MRPVVLYEWFARSVERYPEAVALEVGGEALTYRELHRRVEALAARIRSEHGPRPGRVALLANRTRESFTGYLAALRLGATVVPLSPEHPVHRNGLIIDLARPEVLLVEESAIAALERGLRQSVGTVLTLTPGSTARRAGLPPNPAAPDDIAYILFTSGSTGRPKGVPISHRNLMPYIAHNIARYAVGPGSRVSHTFDLTFDPSVFDLFVTWGAGATLVCPQRAELLAPVEYLSRGRLTHWFSVPSLVSVGADLGNLPAGLPTDLRHSIFIGEQLTYQQARAWRTVAPAAPIDNVYGPTELTVACTEYRLRPNPRDWPVTANDTVPIGPVYDFLDHIVLDGNGEPAPEGELCVRGAQRFAGYLDPVDNHGRFIAGPAGRRARADVGHRGGIDPDLFYRTGDRVRSEGNGLLHLGRLDSQVKIRGHRIELGEVEAILARHPGVTRAVVLAIRPDDEPRLAACYTGTPLPNGQLVRWLRERLPIHLVPLSFRHLETLPLNANGKTDRPALAELLLADVVRPGPAVRTTDPARSGGA